MHSIDTTPTHMASFTVKCLDGIEWKYLPVVVRSTALLSDFIDRVMPMIRPSWKGEDVAMKHVNSGQGLINDLIGFYNKSADEKDIILLRVNGDNTDLYIDRAREVFMRCLFSSANLGPPVYCEFENGLCYQFIHGRTLEYSKLYDPLILQKIAELFALFHTCKLPEQLSVGCQAVAPITFLDSLFPMITDAMCEFPRFKEVFGSKDVLLNEFSYIKRLLDGFSSPVALCHNDLHPGNIIISGENGNCRLWFIDFEFAGPNYTACEIGSFFCEYAGQDLPNYTLCPNMEEQKRFIKTYLELVNKFKGMEEM